MDLYGFREVWVVTSGLRQGVDVKISTPPIPLRSHDNLILSLPYNLREVIARNLDLCKAEDHSHLNEKYLGNFSFLNKLVFIFRTVTHIPVGGKTVDVSEQSPHRTIQSDGM